MSAGLYKICLFGPESTGKSTLARDLAAHYGALFVPEYARELIAGQGGRLAAQDIDLIARGQIAAEDRLAARAMAAGHRLLFCDSDPLTTAIWSERLFGACPGWIRAEAARRPYDLYLLTDIDVPWVADTHRFLPEERASFLARCEEELASHGKAYVKLSGTWDARFNAALAAVNALLNQSCYKEGRESEKS